jgi:hypothetical protein
MNATPPSLATVTRLQAQQFVSAAVRAFHSYASWLVGISWKRFLLLSVLLMLLAGVLQSTPPFSWRYTETLTEDAPVVHAPQRPAAPHVTFTPHIPAIRIERPGSASGSLGNLEILIDEHGVRIGPGAASPASAASARAAASATATTSAEGATDAPPADDATPPADAASSPSVTIRLPPGADSAAVRAAVEEAKQAVVQAIKDAQQAREDAADAAAEVADAARDAADDAADTPAPRVRTRSVRYGEDLPQWAFFWIFASAVLKITYKGRIRAEAVAAQATETAESESLKRQVVEARMAAMQAQVEPHFLFNTLASIDHLIETDPKRASVMQKNLIALLRASMPTMREASDGGVRDLGRELTVIRPYLEILKVRMEERLATDIDVPDGLLSAEFPPMMIQTLVENAIKHGLEPKAEGGTLRLKAEIVHGKLQVVVADTGLGFGKAATAGTGVGLANIRERLQLLYGGRASLTVAANQPTGTVVTITVPYKTVAGAHP